MTVLQQVLYDAASAVAEGRRPARPADVCVAADVLNRLVTSEAFLGLLIEALGQEGCEAVQELLADAAGTQFALERRV